MRGEASQPAGRIVVVGAAGGSDSLVEALVEDGLDASRRTVGSGLDDPGDPGDPVPITLVLDLRGGAPSADEVAAHVGSARERPTVVAVVPYDTPDATAQARALGATTVLVDDHPERHRLPALIRAVLPHAGTQLDALLGALSELRARAVRDADEVQLARKGLTALVAAVDLPGALLLRPGRDEGTATVVAGAGDLADVPPDTVLELASVGALPTAGMAVAVPSVVVGTDAGSRELESPALLVGVSGQQLAGVLVQVAAGGPPEAELVDVARSVTALLDQELSRVRVEVELRERVKELDALRQVQVAVQQRPPRPELGFRVVSALVSGMRHRGAARAELELDGERTVSGVDGPYRISIGTDVVVDGVIRGELRVGYVEDHQVTDPEEVNLLDAIAETLSSYLAREAARDSLAASEERQRRVLEGLPTIVWTVDPDGVVHTLSGGEPPPRGQGSFPTDLPDGAIADRLRRGTARALAGEPVHEQLSWDDRRWDLRIEPLRDRRGRVEEVLCLADDITVQHRAHELEARLASLVQTARVGIVALELDGTIVSWNQGAARMFGWSADEVVGQHIDLLDPQDPDEPMLWSAQAADVGLDVPYRETKRRHRDGHVVEVGVSLAVVTGDDGAVSGASAVYLDLSERNQARRAREASELQFQLLADHAQDVVYRYRLEPDSGLEYVSPSAETVFGYPLALFFEDPMPLLDRVHPADRALLAIEPMTASGARARIRFQHADGRWRWFEDRRTAIEVDGRTVAIAGIARDVTDEQRSADAMRVALERERAAAAQLRRVDDMKSAFLSAVSHELRTPLTSVIGFAETTERLLAERDVAPDILGLLHRVVSNARRLEGLVDDLLDVDRLAKGDVEPRRLTTDLAELVGRAVNRNASPHHDLIADLEEVELGIDPMMIDRAVDNLLRNAIRHTPPGTTVWVRVRRGPGAAVIVVEDDGPGVPPELHRRVFEPFQQGPIAQGAASPGTGIGLSLVQRFIEVHEGTVTLEDREGGGARFRIRLPDVS